MTEDESILQYEGVEEEINTVRVCPQCDAGGMIVRDPSHLPNMGVFSYCPDCGCTYSVRILIQ